MAPEPLHLVMFDLDGTLVDSVADLKAALDGMYRDLGLSSASIEDVRRWVGNGSKVLVQRALAYDILGGDSPLFEQANASFLHHYGQVNGAFSHCYDGALELISRLRGEGVNVAVVTNKPITFTLPLLSAKGLNVDWVLGGDSLAEKKPSPLPLLSCLEQFGCLASQAVMVGDSRNDIEAAASAGVKSAAVSYGYNHGVPISESNADLIVDSLLELR